MKSKWVAMAAVDGIKISDNDDQGAKLIVACQLRSYNGTQQ